MSEREVFIHSHALCESDDVGSGTRIWAFAHVLPGARIGKDCNICDGVFIENDVVVGERVTLVSSAEETAKDVYRVLQQTGLDRDPEAPAPVHRFLATGDPEPFARLGRRFLGPEIGTVTTLGAA